jgi:hypothetical protein
MVLQIVDMSFSDKKLLLLISHIPSLTRFFHIFNVGNPVDIKIIKKYIRNRIF